MYTSRKVPRMTDITTQGECQVIRGEHPNPLERICHKPAVLRYPAMGGGYMRLCAEHGEKHKRYCGVWTGSEWTQSEFEDPPGAAALRDPGARKD